MGILWARILEWVAMPFLQGIFPTQGWKPGLQRCRLILYRLSHHGSPVNDRGNVHFAALNKNTRKKENRMRRFPRQRGFSTAERPKELTDDVDGRLWDMGYTVP